MNFLSLKRAASRFLMLSRGPSSQHALYVNAARTFSVSGEMTIGQAVSSFYARGEADEITVTGVAKTMGEILKTHVSAQEHQQYHPIADELAYYVIKLLSQPKKPFVSH